VVVISNDHSVEDAVAALAAGAQIRSYSDLRQLRHWNWWWCVNSSSTTHAQPAG